MVFNRVEFFDPNFINPAEGANTVARIMQGTVSGMYYTFFVIAGSVFVVAALVIGIKLAISSIASQKAQYKQAIMNWLIGLVMLFTVHFLMAGIFLLNEQICQVAYDASTNSDLVFKFQITEIVPGYGKAITSIINTITGWLADAGEPQIGEVTVTGFSGFLVTVFVKALGGDIVMSILLIVMLGQTCALIFSYIKRLFYCILLGMLAPLVIAVDVVKKSL